MSYKIISYYTTNTPYEKIVVNLENSLKMFQLPYKIYPKPSEGSWTKNTQIKSKVILEALNEFQEDIIWVDADAIFERQPYLFELLEHKEFDLCCHYLHTKYNANELLSGTLYFRNNIVVKQLVKDWIELNKVKEEWDQKTLQTLIEDKYKDTIKTVDLPSQYIKIDKFEHWQGQVIAPVITHFQASRQYRNMSW